jgi:hypothetical protein
LGYQPGTMVLTYNEMKNWPTNIGTLTIFMGFGDFRYGTDGTPWKFLRKPMVKTALMTNPWWKRVILHSKLLDYQGSFNETSLFDV